MYRVKCVICKTAVLTAKRIDLRCCACSLKANPAALHDVSVLCFASCNKCNQAHFSKSLQLYRARCLIIVLLCTQQRSIGRANILQCWLSLKANPAALHDVSKSMLGRSGPRHFYSIQFCSRVLSRECDVSVLWCFDKVEQSALQRAFAAVQVCDSFA